MGLTKEEFIEKWGELAKQNRVKEGPCDEYTLTCYAHVAQSEAKEIYTKLMDLGVILVEKNKRKNEYYDDDSTQISIPCI